MAGGEVLVITEVEGASMGVGTLLEVARTMGAGTRLGELLGGVVGLDEVVAALGLGIASNEEFDNALVNGKETVRKK